MKPYWQQSIQDILHTFHTSVNGLDAAEALRRVNAYGFNVLRKEASFSAIKLFLHQFKSIMFWILVAAAFISYLAHAWMDALSIALFGMLNIVFGFLQEYKAEKEISALGHIVKPSAKVMREGVVRLIPVKDLVPGDCVFLEKKDRVPADGRVITSNDLCIQEVMLTGESQIACKITEALLAKELIIEERTNMVFMGTVVMQGEGLFIVTATGAQTEIGKIAHKMGMLTQVRKLAFPVKKIRYWLTGMSIFIIAAIFILGLIRKWPFIKSAIFGVTTLIAALPEGLPVIITFALALALSRMRTQKILIRRLTTLDVLGRVTILCIHKADLPTKSFFEKCKKAGIRIIIMTSEIEPVQHLAQQLGLVEMKSLTLEGTELDQMNDETLKDLLNSVSLITRITPEHKVRIIHSFQERGEIVAMTGDSMTDIPALKAADIGIALGLETQAVKEAADMIIVDNSFDSILHAIKEARGAHDNIISCVSYLLSCNMAELIIIFFGAIAEVTLIIPAIILAPIHIFWLNLITDGLPAVALALDPLHPHLMRRSVRSITAQLLSASFAYEVMLIALIIALGALIAGYSSDFMVYPELGSTMILTALIMLEFVRVHLVRAPKGLSLFSNMWLIAALVLSLILQFIIIYTPALRTVFKLAPLQLHHWALLIGITAIVWTIGAIIGRYFQRR